MQVQPHCDHRVLLHSRLGLGNRLLDHAKQSREQPVLLPSRPNGVTGWIPDSGLKTARSGQAIKVDVSDRKLTLLNAGRPAGTCRSRPYPCPTAPDRSAP